MRLEPVGKVEEFPEGEAREVLIGARRIAVYHIDGKFHAIKNICPHQEVLLHKAAPRNGHAVCNGHGWEFDLRSGQCVRGQKNHRVAVYPVKVIDNVVHVDVG